MDERTDELRDLFESVTGTETVTERQRRSRGSLTSETDPKEAIEAEVEAMRSALSFETDLPTGALVTVVQGFYQGDTDAEISAAVEGQTDTEGRETAKESVDSGEISQARLDLHLVRESERPGAETTRRLREIEDGAETVSSVAAELDCSEAAVRRWLAVREAQAERRRVADRYRQAFESALEDRDIADRLTSSLEETGLEGAVEDQEVDVDM